MGTGFRLLIRMHLSVPHGGFIGNPHSYNVVVTSHALVIIFFFVMPISIGGFGNWLVPLILISPDMGFPRLNNFRFWVLPFSIGLVFCSVLRDGGFGGGWTLYPPLSRNVAHSGAAIDFLILALHLGGISSIFASINFYST